MILGEKNKILTAKEVAPDYVCEMFKNTELPRYKSDRPNVSLLYM